MKQRAGSLATSPVLAPPPSAPQPQTLAL